MIYPSNEEWYRFNNKETLFVKDQQTLNEKYLKGYTGWTGRGLEEKYENFISEQEENVDKCHHLPERWLTALTGVVQYVSIWSKLSNLFWPTNHKNRLKTYSQKTEKWNLDQAINSNNELFFFFNYIGDCSTTGRRIRNWRDILKKFQTATLRTLQVPCTHSGVFFRKKVGQFRGGIRDTVPTDYRDLTQQHSKL